MNDNNMKKLTRSRELRMICGVCGGLGEFFGVDPTIIRLLFAIFGCTGTGLLVYFIAAAIIPNADEF